MAKIIEMSEYMAKATKPTTPQSKVTAELYSLKGTLAFLKRANNYKKTLEHMNKEVCNESIRIFESIKSDVELLIELSEEQDRTAVYNARKGQL